MDDLISRQEAIDIVRHECSEWKGLAKEIVKQLNGLTAEPSHDGFWNFYSISSTQTRWSNTWRCTIIRRE